ncbi:MAG: hypothetical protein KBT11_00605 [Treponema sp.]|nr:hypothetical protein [Candidatus Treponema equifaecale]
MTQIDQSEQNFKASPLGFLMSVLAKFSAFAERSLSSKKYSELEAKNKAAKDALSNIKIELSQNSTLKNQVSNEAVMMAVLENFPKQEQDTVLETIFDYLGILDEGLATVDKASEQGQLLINEYYDVSRLGLILNCYLGQFDNDDFFYGTLAHVLETINSYYVENNEENSQIIQSLCASIISKIEKAGIDLPFSTFLEEVFASFDPDSKKIFYKNIVKSYADSLLEKIITKEPDEDDGGRLACVKQIQRQLEKLML